MQNSPKIAELFKSLPAHLGAEHVYSQPIAGLDVPDISPIYGLQLAIWQLRDQDLQKKCPLDSHEGRRHFLAWCVVHGRNEYAALRQLTPFWKTLSQPAKLPHSEWSSGISRLLQLAIIERRDLGIDPELKSAEAQRDALNWFLCSSGWKELGLDEQDIPGWQRRFLLDDTDTPYSRFARLVFENRPDLQAAFRLDSTEGRTGFKHWLAHYAPQETALPLLQKIPLQAWPAHNTLQPTQPSNDRFGVNLIGYAFGELGIGEDVRMAAHACQAAGIPFCVIDFAPGSNIRQQDRSIAQWVTDSPRYGINLVCLTALEHLRLFVERGAELFRGRYTIGYWPWELHDWPANWEHCFNLIDEAWASSRHIRQAMQRVSPVPVHWMPMAVRLPAEIDLSAPRQRTRFGLPPDKTLFVFSFDGNSFISRKNPLGVLEAFQQAFSSTEQHVGLVIKCMRPDPQNPIWQQIQSAAQDDPRIFIIDAMLDKADVLELYRACDCFVSLHRAEGFGRGIAEALLLGLEVIATGYGGNVDFCEPAAAHLVPSRPVQLNAEDYVEGAGNQWAEPDITAAAQAMRAITGLQRAGSRSAETSSHLFAPSSIGTRYHQRLSELHAALHAATGTAASPTPLIEPQHP